VLLTAPEAEHLINALVELPIEEVGSVKWMRQHEYIEKLNLQAHHNAMLHSDEFVMETLVSLDKIPVLVHELLCIEAWKEAVWPHLKREASTEARSVNVYLVLYHEAAIANLLEVVLFHRHACEAAGDDALLELCDWCQRKQLYLHRHGPEFSEFKELDAQALLKQTPLEDMEEKLKGTDFGIALASLSILRYLTDYMNDLPVGVMTRLVTTNDTLMTLVPLLDSPPWVRRNKKKKCWEKYVDGSWSAVKSDERLRLTQLDAQVWLALNNLVVDPKVRSKYMYDDFRKNEVLKLKRHMNEVLFDQLPVLKDLQRVLEELTMQQTPGSADITENRLLLEQIPEIRSGILSRGGWEELAREQLETHFKETKESKEADMKRMKEMMAMFDFGEMMEAPKCASCGQPAQQRCSRCKNEWYCGRKCQVGVWKQHKPLCDVMTGKAKPETLMETVSKLTSA